MKGQGNGIPEQCALNLLMITRGEVPYDRIRGRNGTLTDAPTSQVSDAALADAEWLLETYEPRIEIDSIDIEATIGAIGEYGLAASLRRKEEDQN